MADTTISAAHRGANPATILQLEAERLRQLRDELDHLDDVEQIGPVLTDVANQLEALVVSGAVMLSRDGAALVRGALRRALEAQGGAKRPKRLSGLSDVAANGAPHSVTGSIAPAQLGLPFAANLAPRGEVGN